MPEKLEMGQRAFPAAFDLDRDRKESMAFEGGAAAAAMELEEELIEARRRSGGSTALARFRERARTRPLLWGALAFGAAALLTGWMLRFRGPRARAWR